MSSSPEPASGIPDDLPSQLALLEALAAAMTAHEPGEVDGQEAIDAARRTHAALDRLTAQHLAWLGQVQADGLWATQAARTFAQWIATTHQVSLTTARRTAHAATTLRNHLPSTSRAARAGELSTEHIHILVTQAATSPTRRLALDESVPGDTSHEDSPVRGEDLLVHLAQRHTLRDFHQIARRYASVADPEADDRGYTKAHEREYLDLARTTGGYHVAGFLTEEHGQTLSTALRAVIGVPAATGLLTPARRRALALTGMATTLLDHGLAGSAEGDGSRLGPSGTNRPHLSVHVSFTELSRVLARRDLAAGDLAELLTSTTSHYEDGTGPVPDQVLARIAADSAVTRIVFGPDSQVLNIGRSQRTFTAARRRAIIARDKHCVFPGCTAPPAICQIHHAVTHWADGGSTDVLDGALLCWFHHSHVDARGMAMHYDDGWHVGPPGSYRVTGGEPLGADPRTIHGAEDDHGVKGGAARDAGPAGARLGREEADDLLADTG